MDADPLKNVFTVDGQDYRKEVSGADSADLFRVKFNSTVVKAYGFRQFVPLGADLRAMVDLLMRFHREFRCSFVWIRLRVRVWHHAFKKARLFMLQSREKRLNVYDTLLVCRRWDTSASLCLIFDQRPLRHNAKQKLLKLKLPKAELRAKPFRLD